MEESGDFDCVMEKIEGLEVSPPIPRTSIPRSFNQEGSFATCLAGVPLGTSG